MKKLFGRSTSFKFLCGLLMLLAPCVLQAESDAGQPVLHVEQAAFDFGEVREGTLVKHGFVVRNSGSANLKIERIVPACRCTVAGEIKEAIAPGETTTIDVEFDTSGFSGAKLKTLRLYTNDPEQASFLLTLRGVINPDVIAEPQQIAFGQVVKSRPEMFAAKRVTVSVDPDAEAAIETVKSYSKYVTVKMVEDSGQKKVFDVALSLEAPLGEFRERVVVGLKGSRRRSINIPVFASVKSNLLLKPAVVSFGIIEGDSDLKQSVRLENLGPDAVKIESIASSHAAVSAAYEVLEQDKVYQINIVLDPAKVRKEVRAVLTIVTDSKEDKQLLLSVNGSMP